MSLFAFSRFSSSVAAEPSGENSTTLKPSSPYHILNLFDVWVVGLATVICGQVVTWNDALAAGFGSFAIMQFVMMVAYVIFACSLGEMIGMTLFSGGSYGIARVTMGFYGGFMMGALEMLEHILFTTGVLLFMGHHLCGQLGLDDATYFPAICFAYCLSHYLVIRAGHNAYWWILRALVVLSVLMIVIFVLGSARYTDFTTHAAAHNEPENPAATSNWLYGGAAAALGLLPYTTSPLSGIESTILITDMLGRPRRQISYGMAWVIGTLCVMMIGMMFVAPALPFFIAYDDATEFYASLYLTDAGYSLIFGIDNLRTTRWFLFPAQLALSIGLLLPSGKLYYALSDSHLLPPLLQVHREDTEPSQSAVSPSESSPQKPAAGGLSFVTNNAVSPAPSTKNDDIEQGKDTTPNNAKETFVSLPSLATSPKPSSKSSKDKEQSISIAASSDCEGEFQTRINGQKRTIDQMIITKEHQAGMIYSLVVSFALVFLAEYGSLNLDLFVVAIACWIYLGGLYSFIQLRTKYQSSSMSASCQEVLKSPFGIPGAIFAGLVFAICEISCLFFEESYITLTQVCMFFVVTTVYYFLYAKSRQRFSRTEEKTLLALHVITNNRNSNKKRNKKAANSSQQQQYKARMLAQKEQERLEKLQKQGKQPNQADVSIV